MKTQKSTFIQQVILACVFSIFFHSQSANAQFIDKQPNIIFFLVDDMGWQDTSVPFWDKVTAQNKKFNTPNMVRLANKAVKFTNAYATPVCTPSRVSLITGMNAARHKVTNWTSVKGVRTDHNDEILKAPEWNYNGLSLQSNDEHTVYATPFPEILKQNGYFTIHCGKAHFGARGISGANPLNLGFVKNIAGSAAGNPASFLAEKNYGSAEHPDALTADLPNLKSYWGTHIFLTEALTLEAKKAMDTAQQLKKPFFLYMAQYAVHLPFDADKRFVQKYLDQSFSPSEAAYCALVEGMDKSLGDIMDYLDEHQLTDNTIIVFMSDNGGFSHPPRQGNLNTQNAPLRGGKGSVYEGGIREPMLVFWPGVTQKAQISKQYVVMEDFFPTILQMAGINHYQTVQQVDGKSMISFLKNPTKLNMSNEILWHYPNKWYDFKDGVFDNLFISAFRKGYWKLVYLQREQKLELYNLKDDISESYDLSKSQPKVLRKMAMAMTQQMKEKGAQMPTFLATGKLVPYPSDLVK